VISQTLNSFALVGCRCRPAGPALAAETAPGWLRREGFGLIAWALLGLANLARRRRGRRRHGRANGQTWPALSRALLGGMAFSGAGGDRPQDRRRKVGLGALTVGPGLHVSAPDSFGFWPLLLLGPVHFVLLPACVGGGVIGPTA